MSMMNNTVRLVGNAGAEPEIKLVGLDNKKVARFSIAVDESYRNSSGEYVHETQWHQLVLWGKQAEFAEKHIQKGTGLAVKGKLSSRNYVDKEGMKRYVTEVLVREVILPD